MAFSFLWPGRREEKYIASSTAEATEGPERYIASSTAEATEGPPPNDGVAKIIFLGNPGLGKSTLLNVAIGVEVFRSGFSAGTGMTTTCAHWRSDNCYFVDTPGLGDVAGIETMANEALKALQAGSHTRIVFVWGLEAGRLRPMDMAVTKAFIRLLHSDERSNASTSRLRFNEGNPKLVNHWLRLEESNASEPISFGVVINKVDLEEAGIYPSSPLSDLEELTEKYTLTIAEQGIRPTNLMVFGRVPRVNREAGLYYESQAKKNLNTFISTIKYTMLPTVRKDTMKINQFHDDLDGGARVQAAIAQMKRKEVQDALDKRDAKLNSTSRALANGMWRAFASSAMGAGVMALHSVAAFCSIM